MLTKTSNGVANGPRLKKALAGVIGGSMDRRTFLKRSGVTAGGAVLASAVPLGMVKEAKAATAKEMKKIKSVCTHCAVGCTVIAEVDNGVWVGQEPGFDSPINLGAHCAKGASVREHAHNERRLRYPMKLSGGKWVKRQRSGAGLPATPRRTPERVHDRERSWSHTPSTPSPSTPSTPSTPLTIRTAHVSRPRGPLHQDRPGLVLARRRRGWRVGREGVQT